MGICLGGRMRDAKLYSPEGYLDFEKVREEKRFQRGLHNVLRGLQDGHQIAMMCAEKNPLDCHRAILVARAFSLQGVQADHILADGAILTQQEMDVCLLDLYFPARMQVSFFGLAQQERDDVAAAYRMRNKDIG